MDKEEELKQTKTEVIRLNRQLRVAYDLVAFWKSRWEREIDFNSKLIRSVCDGGEQKEDKPHSKTD